MNNDDFKCRFIEEELKTFWPQWHVARRLGGGAIGDVFEIFRDNYGIRTFSALKVLRISDAEASYSLSSGNARPYNAEESCSNFGENNIKITLYNAVYDCNVRAGIGIDTFCFIVECYGVSDQMSAGH